MVGSLRHLDWFRGLRQNLQAVALRGRVGRGLAGAGCPHTCMEGHPTQQLRGGVRATVGPFDISIHKIFDDVS